MNKARFPGSGLYAESIEISGGMPCAAHQIMTKDVITAAHFDLRSRQVHVVYQPFANAGRRRLVVRRVLDHSLHPSPKEDLSGGDFLSLQEQPSMTDHEPF
jgi:hypothetical protein